MRDPVDYPDFAEAVAKVLLDGQAERGVLVCGSGVGASVAANKIPGIRAGLCHDTYSARQGVEHDDMNLLVLGARVIGVELARELVEQFFGGEIQRRRAPSPPRRERSKALERRYGKADIRERRDESFERAERAGTVHLAGLYPARFDCAAASLNGWSKRMASAASPVIRRSLKRPSPGARTTMRRCATCSPPTPNASRQALRAAGHRRYPNDRGRAAPGL